MTFWEFPSHDGNFILLADVACSETIDSKNLGDTLRIDPSISCIVYGGEVESLTGS